MKILGIHRGHNGGVCLLEDGEVTFHLEQERLDHHKNSGELPLKIIQKAVELADYEVDVLVLSGFTKPTPADFKCTEQLDWHFGVDANTKNDEQAWKESSTQNVYVELLKLWNKKDFTFHSYHNNHHELHAAIAFYNSGFTEAISVVADGSGALVNSVQGQLYEAGHNYEIQSVFYATYPSTITPVIKENTYHKNNPKINHRSLGLKFTTAAVYLGMEGGRDSGKVMGLASYGKKDNNVPNIDNTVGDWDIAFFEQMNNYVPSLKDKNSIKHWVIPNDENFQKYANLAYWVQTDTQEYMLNLIKRGIKEIGIKNVTISGGYGFNVVANYYIRKNLPDDINLYVEPISNDGGMAIAAAKLWWHQNTSDRTIRPLKSLYLGEKPNYDNLAGLLNNDESLIDTNYSNIIDLILDKNIVAIYQGRSESGPRALGNRSILFDPRVPNGKDIVNVVKKREWYRPFAGSIMEEHVHDWFDMAGLKNSPFMMYGVDVLEDKKSQIPAITHVDGTCRIQTVTEEQNYHYYNLIKEFYNRTGVPILFDTSFNLAGDTMVETIEDALWTSRNSDIKYIYFADLGKLYIKNGNIE